MAAWWVLFYRLHRPEALWRRIALLIAIPGAYAFWIFTPMNYVGNTVSWAAITVVFAFFCGDLRRTLFTAFFYIGMEHSIDNTRSAMIAMIRGEFFETYSPAQYWQWNLQYLFVLAVCCFYFFVVRRYRSKPVLSSWVLCILPLSIVYAIIVYAYDIALMLLRQQGINIFGPIFCFGLFGIFLSLIILYLYTRRTVIIDSQQLAIDVSNVQPLWTSDKGLSEKFCERYSLTEREKTIVEVMMRGKSNKEIAEELLIFLRTVENYLQNVYKKTGVTNRFALFNDKRRINRRIGTNRKRIGTYPH